MANPINSKHSFGYGLLLYGSCIAVTAFVVWPWIKDNMMQGGGSYSDLGEYGGSTGARNHSGVEPYGGDGHGGGRGYSDYFPGAREARPAREARRPYPLHLDPTQTDDIEDRRGEHRGGLDRLGPAWEEARRPETTGDARGLACWDRQEHRRVDPSFCGRR